MCVQDHQSCHKKDNVPSKNNRVFPCNLVSRESACLARDPGSIPGSEEPLEKEMVTHSSFLAWRIPWTQEPGGLQSMQSQSLSVYAGNRAFGVAIRKSGISKY